MTLQSGPRCGIPRSGVVELYFYGELDPAECDRFERHVSVCGECRRALDESSVIRAALAARPVVDAPPAGDWSAFMSRLGSAIERQPNGGYVRRAGFVAPPPSAARASYAGYIAMAALLALVTVSVAFVAHWRSGTAAPAVAERTTAHAAEDHAAEDRAAETHGAEDRGADDRTSGDNDAFAALSEEHFERSKLVVLGLATKDAAHARSNDWTYERELASQLLTDTRMYRLAAEDRGLQTLAGVMRDLELVLLQTSLTDETDPASLAQIQRLIRKRDLLQKMDVVSTAGL